MAMALRPRSISAQTNSVRSFCLALSTQALLFSCLGAVGLASPTRAAGPAQAMVAAEGSADRLMELLRERDQLLERWARQMSHPRGISVSQEDLRSFTDGLARLEMQVRSLADGHPELAAKHAALVRRGRELVGAASRSREENASLAPADESLRWLVVPQAALMANLQAEAPSQSACDAAPRIGAETRAVPSLDGSNEALLRFVPPHDGRYVLDTAGSRTDTTLAVYDACRGGRLIASSDDEVSLRARLPVTARAGVPLWIRLGSDRSGWVRLSVELSTEGIGAASISGLVTAAATGLPIANVQVRATLEGGSYDYVYTATDGSYQVVGLDAGTYEVHTRDSTDNWVNQIWQGVQCGVAYWACEGVDGDPIVVGEGQQVDDIDFTLSKPGILSGRVLDADTDAPLAGVLVRAFRQGGSSTGNVATDEAGRYRFERLDGGAYFIKATAPFHADELFDGIPCSGDCDVSTGTPVLVAADDVVAGINFELERITSIGGRIVEDASGEPVWGVYIQVVDERLQVVAETSSYDGGQYWVDLPAAGTYYAVAAFTSWDSWESQVFEGINCVAPCDPSVGDPIVVADGELAAGVDFSLVRKGSLAGSVEASDAGEAEAYTTYVAAYDSSGGYVDDQFLYDFGSYSLEYLPMNDYFVLARNSEFRAEVYDDIQCAAGNICDPESGTAVHVTSGTTTGRVDFLLDRLGVVSGTVVRQGSGTPVVGASVFASSVSSLTPPAGGNQIAGLGSVNTDDSGDFRIFGMEPGSYYIRAYSSAWQDEAYDDLPCEGGCDLSMADPVPAAIGTETTGIDFALERTGWIEGTVTAAGTGDPLNSSLRLVDSFGLYVYGTSTNAQGEYLIQGLVDGTYYLMVNAAEAYVDELFDDIPCMFSSFDPTCDPTSGTAIAVSVENGATVDFALDVGGVIEGRITDTFGGGLVGHVDVFDTSGQLVKRAYSEYDGEPYPTYRVEGLAAGDYYLVTALTGARDELWPNTPCLGSPAPACSLTAGTPVPVTLGATTGGIDFVLDPLATITGLRVSADTGEAFSDGRTALYSATGSYLGSSYSSPFQFTSVPPGTYYLQATSVADHLPQVYGGETCDPSCDVTTGTPIVVDIGHVVSGIEIPMIMGPGLWGRVVDLATGQPVPGVAIDVWYSTGEHGASAVTDGAGEYRLPVDSEIYFVSTDNADGFTDLLHDHIECPDGSAWQGLCDPTAGTPFVVAPYQPLQRLDFVFGEQFLFADGFEGGLGAWSSTVGAD